MAYQLNQGQLFDIGINTEREVLGYLAQAKKFLHEPKTQVAWASEGDSATLDWALPLDYIISECRYFLKRLNPQKYGYIVTSARQIRF
jgi:hypothetical protein